MDAILQAFHLTGLGSWLAVGVLASAGARFLPPGRAAGGCVVTVLVGIAGALLGGLLATYLRFGGLSAFDLRSLAIAALGALLLLMLLRLATRRPADDA
jgi:uncharacterized membrane protein YeaQ/YmgE (transglycosylase-associated protein family)